MTMIDEVLLMQELKAFAHPNNLYGVKYRNWLQKQLASLPSSRR